MDWLANQSPPWGTYRDLMYGRLIVLDNLPGVRPLGIRETWRQFFAKCMLKFMGPEATHTCKDDQLCMGLKSGIDGAVHMVQSIWYANSTK